MEPIIRPIASTLSVSAIALCLLLLSGAEKAAGDDHPAKTAASTRWDEQTSWRRERDRREALIERYLLNHQDEFQAFKNVPLAIKQSRLTFVGIPVIMFRLFPQIFPDIWGPPQDQMAIVGFGPDPFEPANVMPLGWGYALSVGFQFPGAAKPVRSNYAALTCMGCHTGAVTGPDGELIRLIGAPNDTIGNFFGVINETVNDPRYTVANFLNALNEKPLGWVYYGNNRAEIRSHPTQVAQEKLERALFNAPGGAAFFLEEVRVVSNQGAIVPELLLESTYSVPNAPPFSGVPGSQDVFAVAGATVAAAQDPPLTSAQLKMDMPPAPAPTDILRVWDEQNRPHFQWGDEITNLTFRVTAADLAIAAGDSASVNQTITPLVSAFVDQLPAPPYPFHIDEEKAARGKVLYQQACEACHKPGNNLLLIPDQTGTDPNRTDVFTPFIVANYVPLLRSACTIPSCYGPNGTPVPDSEILQPTGAYAAIPLSGIWATAPYLHNGSVPTLWHLLTGERPAKFYRGNTTYDQEHVGFTWDKMTRPTAVELDTSWSGYSNTGHTGSMFSGGIDWKNEPKKLEDLLEYLKTL